MSVPSIDPAARKALGHALGSDRLRRDVVLAPYTTFKIGGPADFFVEAHSADELAEANRRRTRCVRTTRTRSIRRR